jgi:hypothetical protein
MNVTLWILQVLLAAAFTAHGWMLLAPPPELLPIMHAQLGVGFRLFLGIDPALRFRFLEARLFACGVVLLRYGTPAGGI